MRAPDPLKGWSSTAPADCLPVQWSAHAVEQYVARIREMDLDAARHELSAMLASARVTRERPAWLPDRGAHCYLRLGDEIALPLWRNHLGELVAATTLSKSMPSSDEDRERENAWRRNSRAGKKASRLAIKHGGGRRIYLPPTNDVAGRGESVAD
jgi:hypothetical protein